MAYEVDSPGSSLDTWIQIIHTYNRILRSLEAEVHRSHLTLSQYEVLAQVYKAEGITQQDLSKRLLIVRGNLCGLLDRLSQGRYLARCGEGTDRRTHRLYLTEAGQAIVEQIRPGLLFLIREIMTDLDPGEQETLNHLLQRLHDRAAQE